MLHPVVRHSYPRKHQIWAYNLFWELKLHQWSRLLLKVSKWSTKSAFSPLWPKSKCTEKEPILIHTNYKREGLDISNIKAPRILCSLIWSWDQEGSLNSWRCSVYFHLSIKNFNFLQKHHMTTFFAFLTHSWVLRSQCPSWFLCLAPVVHWRIG